MATRWPAHRCNGQRAPVVSPCPAALSLLALIAVSGCAVSDVERHRVEERDALWRAEFIDYRYFCRQAGGFLVFSATADHDGMPPRGSRYDCTRPVRETM